MSSQASVSESDSFSISSISLDGNPEHTKMAHGGHGFNLNEEITEATTTRPSTFDVQVLETQTPELHEFITLMMSYLSEEDVMQSIINAVSYQGSDPVFIRKLISKLQPDAELRKKQISFLIVLLLSRGS